MMFGAGIASGLLGIGSGAFKVIAMDTIMHMPLKPSSATSNLMMGVTAAASATVYFFNGSLQPQIAGPLAIGIIVGALIGSRIMQVLPTRVLRMIFIPIVATWGCKCCLKDSGEPLMPEKNSPSLTEENKEVELVIGKILRVGVIVAAAVIIFGSS